MIIYYVVTAYKSPAGLVAISVILNVGIQVILIVIGFTDPGIVPKVLEGYENKKLRRIPLDSRY
jgi:hypothetical protein